MEPVNPYAPPETDTTLAPAWQSAPIVESWQRFVPGNDLIATTFSTYGPAHARAVKTLAALPLWFWLAFCGGAIGSGCLAAWMGMQGEDFAFVMLIGAAACTWLAIRTLLMRRRTVNTLLEWVARLPMTEQAWYEDHLAFVNPLGRSLIRWDGLRKARWLDGVLMMQLGPVAWFMFPDGLFAPRGARAVIELLRRKWTRSPHEPTLQALERFFASEPPLRADQQVIAEALRRQWRTVPILPLERIVLGSQVLAPALGTEHWVTRRPDVPSSNVADRSFLFRTLSLFALGLLIGLPLVIFVSIVMLESNLNVHLAVLVVMIAVVGSLLIILFPPLRKVRRARLEGVMSGGGVTLFSDEGIYQITIDALMFTLWGAIVDCQQTSSRMKLVTQHGVPVQLDRADFSADDWQRLLTYVPARIAAAARAANDAPSTADEISMVPQPPLKQ